MIIGLAGNAQSGKDSLCKILTPLLSPARRFSLGDILKQELDYFCQDQFGFSAHTSILEQKTLIRPLLVEYARIKRKVSQGTYFTEKLTPQLDIYDGSKIITDIRYDEYPEDEYSWLRKIGGKLVFIEKTLKDGTISPPPNEDERTNNLKLKQNADLIVCWPELPERERDEFFKENYLERFESIFFD